MTYLIKNCIKSGKIPDSITLSIGGCRSADNNRRIAPVASNCCAGLFDRIPATNAGSWSTVNPEGVTTAC